MLARSDPRGLGVLTQEFYRHMQPAKTLVIAMGELTPYDERHGIYPDGRVTQWAGGDLDDEAIDWILSDVDVLYTAETPYDYRLLTRARERGVATVVQAMWEFCRWPNEPDLPRPDLFLAPSSWYFGQWPEPKTMLPVPVARDRLPPVLRTAARTFLHIGGHRAYADRNGTAALIAALPWVRSDVRVIIRTQDPVTARNVARRTRVDLEIRDTNVGEYWELYDEGDVLVQPRRYGGLSLPMNEGMSRAMPVLASDMDPQRSFLPRETLIPVRRRRRRRAAAQIVEMADINAQDIAAAIDRLASDDDLVARASVAADEHASSISWEALGPRYRAMFENVANAFAR
jgi:hypothetical protein